MILCSLGMKLKFHTLWNNTHWYLIFASSGVERWAPNLTGAWAPSLVGMKIYRFTSLHLHGVLHGAPEALHSFCGWILHSSESIIDFLNLTVRPSKSVRKAEWSDIDPSGVWWDSSVNWGESFSWDQCSWGVGGGVDVSHDKWRQRMCQ